MLFGFIYPNFWVLYTFNTINRNRQRAKNNKLALLSFLNI